MPSVSDTNRLERLWAGEFGDAYVRRNFDAGANRRPFWDAIRRLWPFDSVLEVGCNVGANLVHFTPYVSRVAGVDINPRALTAARQRLPDVTLVEAPARSLPFPCAFYDMAFVCGVWIHLPEDALEQAMRELVRVSRRYVLAMEYYAPEREEVPYRDQPGSLHRDDYGKRLLMTCPELKPVGFGFAGTELGFDRTTWWMFAK